MLGLARVRGILGLAREEDSRACAERALSGQEHCRACAVGAFSGPHGGSILGPARGEHSRACAGRTFSGLLGRGILGLDTLKLLTKNQIFQIQF